jgi:hypothetical protein
MQKRCLVSSFCEKKARKKGREKMARKKGAKTKGANCKTPYLEMWNILAVHELREFGSKL